MRQAPVATELDQQFPSVLTLVLNTLLAMLARTVMSEPPVTSLITLRVTFNDL